MKSFGDFHEFVFGELWAGGRIVEGYYIVSSAQAETRRLGKTRRSSRRMGSMKIFQRKGDSTAP